MENPLTVKDLETRWENALQATRRAAAAHPELYRQVKALAAEIVHRPIDINDYFPTVEKLVDRLNDLDPGRRGSIFGIFSALLSPSTIWQVRMLRVECTDLLAHLDVFDKWRRETVHLRLVSGSKRGGARGVLNHPDRIPFLPACPTRLRERVRGVMHYCNPADSSARCFPGCKPATRRNRLFFFFCVRPVPWHTL